MNNTFKINELLKSNYVKELVAQARKEAKKDSKKIQPTEEIKDHGNFDSFVTNVKSWNKRKIISDDTKDKLTKLNDLFDADEKLNTELNKFYQTEKNLEYKKSINSLVETLQKHQQKNLDIKPPTSPPPNTELIDLIQNKIKLLDEISDQRFPEAQDEKASAPSGAAGPASRGGSISTNNSIRRQIFTDLKYITKYLKYKTKYIVFKSKH